MMAADVLRAAPAGNGPREFEHAWRPAQISNYRNKLASSSFAESSADRSYSSEFAEYPRSVWTPLSEMRAQMSGILPTEESVRYRRSLGVDLPTLFAECGCLVVGYAEYFANRTFDIVSKSDDRAMLSAIIEVFDFDRETTVDLVAWPIDRPDKFATAIQHADGLGVWRAQNPATYHGGSRLRVFRSPDEWLRNGCDGAVILHSLRAPRWLGECPGEILAEDIDHGREIARMLHPFFSPRRILAPFLEGAN
jgi:hypothetical protein